TAIFALTFVVVREYRIEYGIGRSGVTAHTQGEILPGFSDAATRATVVLTTPVSSASGDQAGAVEAGVIDAAEPTALAVDSSLTLPVQKASALPPEELTPSARAIAANLAVAQAAAPAVMRGLLAPSRGFEARALPVRVTPVEPLQQMTTPAQVRSARLLSAMVVMSNDSSPRTERVASRISGEQLYDAARRLSAKGDSFSVKF
ncbi:MAG: hypothetical protein RIQ93_899, partial [Verrucomicrobiota bacterium]